MAETTYRINPELPRYERVPVFREGDWNPSGPRSRRAFDAAYIQALADSYDPLFIPATGNCDHEMWWGRALGVITAVYTAVEAGLRTLYVDIANVPPELAAQIDAGQWPSRSIEWHDAAAISGWHHGEDWELHVDEYLFYGEHELYLTGLAFLGQRLPAVAALGPMPPQAPPAVETDDGEAIEVRIITEPIAASLSAAPRLRLIDTNSRKEDAPMANKAEATTTTTGEPVLQAARTETPAPEASAANQEIRENERLRAEKAELERDADQRQQASMENLAAENARLRQDVEKLRSEAAADREIRERERTVTTAERREIERDRVVAELRAGGHLVPANEAAFIKAYDAFHGQAPTMLATAAGERIAAEHPPLELLLAFARSCKLREPREIAAEEHQRPESFRAQADAWTGEPTEQHRKAAAEAGVSVRAWLKSNLNVDWQPPTGGDQ